MFSIVKPGHVQIRALLPEGLRSDFDEMADVVRQVVPSSWHSGARDRAFAIALGGWVILNHRSGNFHLSELAIRKIEKLISIALCFNERDLESGAASTVLAQGLVGTMTTVDKLLHDSPASALPTASSDEDLHQRKQLLAGKLKRAQAAAQNRP